MNMSRSSLHRKIKALTDLSSLDFIRIIRLKRAAELLQEGELRINEISDRVGFQSPSYFAKIFQKQFGVTPTEFANKISREWQRVSNYGLLFVILSWGGEQVLAPFGTGMD